MLRELSCLRGLARTAQKTGNSTRLRARLESLYSDDADSLGLLLYQYAELIEPARPVKALLKGKAYRKLLKDVNACPKNIIALCDKSIILLPPMNSSGKRGGARRKLDPPILAGVEHLGLYFEWFTKRHPGYTYKPSEGLHTGVFIEFCKVVFQHLGVRVSGGQVVRALSTIDIPRWHPRSRVGSRDAH